MVSLLGWAVEEVGGLSGGLPKERLFEGTVEGTGVFEAV